MTDTTQHDPSKPIACAFCGAISMTVPIKPTHTQELQKQLRELDDEGYQPSTGAIGNKAADALASSDEELARLREQLEVERMRLVACGVVAMANTPESAAINRQMKDEYRSGSLDDVIHIVDSEMALRKQVVAQQARIVELRDALEQSALDSATHGVTCGAVTILRAKALATPDDTAALKAHDDALWKEAVEKCNQTVWPTYLNPHLREIILELKR